MIKILLAEDDKSLNALITQALEKNEYDVTSCLDGVSAVKNVTFASYSLVISDIMMPGADGYEVAKALRKKDSSTPIIFLTAKEDKPSKIYSYQLGVDDYITKPFDMDILMMKIAAILRRAGIEENHSLTVGNFTMNSTERIAKINDEDVPFTVREFDILFKLLSYPKKTFTRSALMEEFWDFDSSATSRTVDVYMAKIRDKTSACDGFDIVTVHGLGYKAVLK